MVESTRERERERERGTRNHQRECQVPGPIHRTAMSNWRHSKKAKQTSSQTLPSSRSPSPNPMPHAHFGSKASFLRCDLQTLNYSRSYRKRRRKKRKESFAQRPNEDEGTKERTKLSIDQWKYSHSGDRQPRREREDSTDTHVMYILRQCFPPRLHGTSAYI